MTTPLIPLSIEDHRRDSAAMTYVYPVVSRRAGGVSVGVNLNPNQACNWRCVYCQVPNLKRGGPPPLDLARLRSELAALLTQITQGDFLQTRVARQARHLRDVAFSGDGEPTSAPEFAAAVAAVVEVMRAARVGDEVALRLITNGSLIERRATQEGLRRIQAAGGEVWFKCDAASATDIARINGSRQTPAVVMRRLQTCAALCPTWLQSCFFLWDGAPPADAHVARYLAFVGEARPHLRGVHLYGLARPSHQAEAARLGRLPAAWLDALGERVRALGLAVTVSP